MQLNKVKDKNMKAKILLLVFMIPFLLGFISDTKSSLKSPDSYVALVKKIIKDVSYRKAGESDYTTAKTGLPLKADEEVKTGPKSLALILFTDGSGLLRVRENSVLKIYAERNKNKLNKNTYIEKGLIGFDVNKQEEEEFKFTTPTAVASIRGTVLFVEVDNSTRIAVQTGSVDFQSTVGKKENGTVTGGYTATIDASGNIILQPASAEDQKKAEMTKAFETKKALLNTPKGKVSIEYYSSQN
jgi:hypothetical protein